VRAVNLVPVDLRRAGSGGGSGSATGSYAVLGVLALALVLVSAWALTSRQATDKQAEVTRLTAQASAAEAQAANLAGYKSVVDVANTRRNAVLELIDARFDWASALRDVSRTVPEGVSLASMTATIAPGVSVEGGGSNPLRANNSGPAIEVEGCAPSQGAVSELISRLRSMQGVSKVALSSTEKTEGSGGGGDSAGTGGSGDCTGGSSERPRFNLVVVFGDGAATTTGTAATGTTTAAAATTTASTPAGTTTTASTTSSTGGTK
jgi:Tfp pilus assembly protein PilN